MTADEVAVKLDRALPKTFKIGRGYEGACPVCRRSDGDKHGDHLMLVENPDGWLYFKCQKGCSQDAIMAALGMTDKDRLATPKDPKELSLRYPEEKYTYTDSVGKYLFDKHRYYKKSDDGKMEKNFSLKIEGVTGVVAKLKDEASVLYKLPDVLRAVTTGGTIYICEGEKACNALATKGCVATCQPFGADVEGRRSKWLPKYTVWLKGALRVVVVADRDEVGENYAKVVALALRGNVKKVEIRQSLTLGAKDDAYDHIKAGHDPDRLQLATGLMPKVGISTYSFNGTFQEREIEFIIPGCPHFAFGKAVLLDAKGATGKSTFFLSFAAACSRGVSFFDGSPIPCGPLKTIYFHKGEDDSEEYEAVYRANGGVPGMLLFVGDSEDDESDAQAMRLDPTGLKRLEETVAANSPCIVIFDALRYFFPPDLDMNKDDQVAVPLTAMNRMGRNNRVMFMNSRHTGKGSKDKELDELGLGSVQFFNSHRRVLLMRSHPEERGVIVVQPLRGSLRIPLGEHFCFRKVGIELQCIPGMPNPFDESAGTGSAGTPKSKLGAAQDLIRSMCFGQYVSSEAIFTAAEKKGISKRTVWDAKATLPVKGTKNGTGFLWHIPDPDATEAAYNAYEDE